MIVAEDDCPQIKPFEMQKPTAREELESRMHKKQIEKSAPFNIISSLS